MAVLADDPRALLAASGVLRQATVHGAVPVALSPVRLGMGQQPIRCHDGQAFQRVAHRLDNALQPVQGAHRSQDVRGVGPLPPARRQQVPLLRKRQHRLEQQQFGSALDQAGPELAQHGAVKAGVG
jgi:hypothetical protein